MMLGRPIFCWFLTFYSRRWLLAPRSLFWKSPAICCTGAEYSRQYQELLTNQGGGIQCISHIRWLYPDRNNSTCKCIDMLMYNSYIRTLIKHKRYDAVARLLANGSVVFIESCAAIVPGAQLVFYDTWNEGFSCVKTWNRPKIEVKSWFAIPVVIMKFFIFAREFVKNVIFNLEIVVLTLYFSWSLFRGLYMEKCDTKW